MTLQEIRQELYEQIVDESLFIARASEGAISVEWVMSQPIFIRKKYVDAFKKEIDTRNKELEKIKSSRR